MELIKDDKEVLSLGGRENCTTDRNRGCIIELVSGNEEDKVRFEYEVTAAPSD